MMPASMPIGSVAKSAACAVCVFGAVNPGLAQTLGQGDGEGISLWRVLGALLLCLSLAVAGAFAIRARMGSGGTLRGFVKRDRRLHLVESLRLSHQVDLCIVTCDGRELLIATSVHGAAPLEHRPVDDARPALSASGDQ